jgi:hypothetical protein
VGTGKGGNFGHVRLALRPDLPVAAARPRRAASLPGQAAWQHLRQHLH